MNKEKGRKKKEIGPSSLSVIIPVRNRPKLIGPCLKYLIIAALEVQREYQVEILVVDDASTDETPAIVLEVEKDSPIPIHLIKKDHRSGPSQARNLGVERAQGELILFVDSDVLVEKGFFAAHLRIHQEEGKGIYGMGKIISVPSLEEAIEQPEGKIWDISGASLDTANSSVLKEHLEVVGAFDNSFVGMGWMDIDLGRRLKEYGLKRTPIPKAISYHIQPPLMTQEALEARLQKERERGVSGVYFLEKYPGLNSRLATQDTFLHHLLNWLFRMGGVIHRGNVLTYVEWARRRGLTALEKMWLAGVINRDYLDTFKKTRQRKAHE